jgi:ATP-dependent Clp protease adapter protein ClpS
MGRVALVSGLCLLALAPVVAERVEAVILLHDDEVHTFRTVSGALESLGLSPPQALLVTSDVHSTGVGLVCKGTRAELRVAYDRLANEGLNVTLRTTEQTDVEVRRAAKLATSGTAAARRVNAALREAAVSRRECTVWSLAGACVREALAMYAHLGCAAECVDNSARFQQAAHRRPPLRVEMISVQVAGVLGAALGAAEAWTRLLRSGGGAGEADDLLPAATAARTRGVATALLAQHFLVAGAREALAAVTGGGEEGSWQLDDSEVAVSFALEGEGEGEGEGEEEGEDFNTEGAGEGGRAAPQPAAEPDMEVPDTELGLSETESDPPDEGEAPSWLAALVFWLGGLLSTLPRWLLFSYGLMQAAAAVAAVVAARVVEGSAADAAAAAAASWSGASAAAQAQADSAAVRLRRSGSLLWLVSILGAGHVLVSAGYMFVMGAGVHVSEVMAKRVSLVGGVAVWLAHVTLVRPGERSRQSEARASRLPMTKRDAASAMGSPFAGCVDGRARRRGALLAAGRMMVAGLLAAVGGTEVLGHSRILAAVACALFTPVSPGTYP